MKSSPESMQEEGDLFPSRSHSGESSSGSNHSGAGHGGVPVVKSRTARRRAET
jgi:hypothetical protein